MTTPPNHQMLCTVQFLSVCLHSLKKILTSTFYVFLTSFMYLSAANASGSFPQDVLPLKFIHHGPLKTAENMTGMWDLTLFSTSRTGNDNVPKKAGGQIKGLLSLTQTGEKITGTFSSRNWNGCKTAEVIGLAIGETVNISITCVTGTCVGSAGISLAGKWVNNTIIGEANPSGSAPSGQCVVFAGNMTLVRSKK